MANFSAGSASVNVVPDFTGGQAAIDRWIREQKPVSVKVKPDLDQSAMARISAELAAMPGHDVKVGIDKQHFASSVTTALDNFAGFSQVGAMFDKIFGPRSTLMVTGVGALGAIGAAASQSVGALALLPAAAEGAAAGIAVLKLGLDGISKAMGPTGTPAQLAAVNKAMADLAPAARDFVKQIDSLKPAFKNLQLDVQQNLFAGLGAQVKSLANADLPVLKTGLGGISTGFNAIAKSMLGVFSQKAVVVDFGTSLKNISTATMNASGGFGSLTKVFTNLATVGSSFLPQLATGFSNVMAKVDAFVQHARDTGQLAKFIQTGIDTIKQLMSIIGNAAGVLVNLFRPAIVPGQIILGVLNSILGQFRAFTASAGTQNNLATFFNNIAGAVKALQPGISALLQAFTDGLLPAIGGIVKSLAPVVNTLLVGFADMLTRIAPLIYPALASALAAIASAIQPVIPALTSIVQTLLPVFTKILIQLAPILGQFTAMLGNELATIAKILAPLLVSLGNAFIAILKAVMPIIPPLFQILNAILPPLVKILQSVIPIIVLIIQTIAPLIVQIANFLVPILTFLGKIVSAVFTVIGDIITFVIRNIIKPELDFVVAVFTNMGSVFRAVYDNVIKPVWDAFGTAVSFVWNNVLKPIWGAIDTAWHALGTAIAWVNDHIIQPVWNAITGALGVIKQGFSDAVAFIGKVWDGIKTVLLTPVQWVIDFVWNNGLRNLWNAINNIWGGNDIQPYRIPGLASGGFFNPLSGQNVALADGGMMPGYTPGRDVHRFYSPTAGMLELSGGEPVMRPEFGAVVGSRWVDEANAAARRGGTSGVRSFLSGQRFADGGIVGLGDRALSFIAGNPVVSWLESNGLIPGGQIIAQLTDYVTKEKGLTGDKGGTPIWATLGDAMRNGANEIWKVVRDSVVGWVAPGGGGWANYHAAQAAQAAAAAKINLGNLPSAGSLGGLGATAGVQAVLLAATPYGWNTGQEWAALQAVIMRESGFNPTAQNPTSSAYGIFQFLNSTWASVGGTKTSDAVAQAIYGMRYIASRYHDPLGALAHEQRYGWYDNGGFLPPGWSTVFNGTGKPETVLNATERDVISSMMSGASGGSTGQGITTVAGFVNNGTVLLVDPEEQAAKDRRGVSIALASIGMIVT